MQSFYKYFLQQLSESTVSEAKKPEIVENYRIHGKEYRTLNGVFDPDKKYKNVLIDDCPELWNLSGLPKEILGDLTIASCPKLGNLYGLMNVETIGGSLNIGGLKTTEMNEKCLVKFPKILGRKINSNFSFLYMLMDKYGFGKVAPKYFDKLRKLSKQQIADIVNGKETNLRLDIPWSALVIVPYLGENITTYQKKLIKTPDGWLRYEQILRDADRTPVGYDIKTNRREYSDLIEKFLLTRKSYGEIPTKVFPPSRGGNNGNTVVVRVAKDGNFLGYGATENEIANGEDIIVTADRVNVPQSEWTDAYPENTFGPKKYPNDTYLPNDDIDNPHARPHPEDDIKPEIDADLVRPFRAKRDLKQKIPTKVKSYSGKETPRRKN